MTTLVVGGGPAGAAFAIRLARAGRRVELFERESEATHKMCGEFLSHEAMGYLAKIGVDLPAAGATPIVSLRLATPAGTTTVPLPFLASSLSRFAMDELLLLAAEREGVTVRRGARVREASTSVSRGARIRLEGGTEHEGDALVLATGKHDLRGHSRPAGMQNDLVAFKMHYRLSAEQARILEGHVELATFVGGYAGLQSIEGGFANLCLLVEKQRLRGVGGGWDGLIPALIAESAHLRARLGGALPRWERPLGLSRIPYGFVRRTSSTGAWHLGDQAAVIPSFAGDGMAMALHSAEVAANTFLQGGGATRYTALFARDVRAQVVVGTGLSKVAVTGVGQRLIGACAALFPFVVSTTASLTRLSHASLRRAATGAS